MKKYILTDRETNNWPLGEYDTMEEAQKELEKNEKEDKENGNFEQDYYQIIGVK
jgi:hypothetical protein